VLRPAWSIHTFFMRFPIDVVFVDADQVVAKVVDDLRPGGRRRAGAPATSSSFAQASASAWDSWPATALRGPPARDVRPTLRVVDQR
jgi:hypothetical protein